MPARTRCRRSSLTSTGYLKACAPLRRLMQTFYILNTEYISTLTVMCGTQATGYTSQIAGHM